MHRFRIDCLDALDRLEFLAFEPSMAPLNDERYYYKRMFELQEKLRKSEEKRIRLEEQFNVLVRESHNRHEICVNRLHMRYIQYLEEQRMRDERNHKLLAALDKVMDKLAMISVRKDRLNILRKQYEAYLLHIYSNRRPPDSVAGDSGIVSQNDDKWPWKTIVAERADLASTETRSVPSSRMYQTPPQLSQSRPISASKIYDRRPVNSTLLNNSTALLSTPVDAPFNIDDYHRTNVLRESYISPIDKSDQFVQVPTTAVSNMHQYSPTIPASYRNASNNLQQDPLNFRIPRTNALSIAPTKSQFDTSVPAGQPFKDHAGLLQTAPDFSTIAWHRPSPIEFERSHVSRQFNSPSTPSQPFQCHDTNILPSDPQSRVNEWHTPRDAVTVESFPTTVKSSAYSASEHPDAIKVINYLKLLPGYTDYIQRISQMDADRVSTHSVTSDKLMRRNERSLWNADVEEMSRRPSTFPDTTNINLRDNDKVTMLLENELDKYIGNIRKLHGEHGALASQDELDYEQNTSGDLLNVTLSEDVLACSTEDRGKRERGPEKMGRLLASNNDFVSRTADSSEAAFQIGRNDNVNSSTEIKDEIRQRMAQNDALQLEGRHDAFVDEADGTAVFTTRNKIREDAATYSPELDADVAKRNGNNINDLVESRECGGETSIAIRCDAAEATVASLNNKSPISYQRHMLQKEEPHVVIGENFGEESNVENLFDTAEELAISWDLGNVQRKVRELHLDDSYVDQEIEREAGETVNDTIGEEIASARFIEQGAKDGETENSNISQDVPPLSRAQMKGSDVSEAEHREEIKYKEDETRGAETCIEQVECFQVSNGCREQYQVDELAAITPQIAAEFGKQDDSDKAEDENDTSQVCIENLSGNVKRDNEYGVERGYIGHPNQTQQYKFEQNPNEQYDYNQRVSYEDVANEEYDKYADQGYAQENQEYVEYVGDQYGQYAEDPDNQQYQHDPTAQYQQDSNQAYDYGYDQQYDINQEYDPNQVYEYVENVPYDLNETYEQECKEQQEQQPDDNIVKVEDREEAPETEGTSLERQTDKVSGHKVDGDQDKLQQINTVNETNRSKKTDVIKSLLDSDTDTTIERNVSNTESDFDFN